MPDFQNLDSSFLSQNACSFKEKSGLSSSGNRYVHVDTIPQYQLDHSRIHRRARRWWVRPWAAENRRKEQGIGENLIPELRETDPESFQNFLRLDSITFDGLLNLISPRIQRLDTKLRNAITAHDKLAVTLRFLASGASYKDLKYSFRISDSTISIFIPEVCDAIYETLRMDYCTAPSTQQMWLKIAEEFEDKWQFPNCLGAIDGKHINIRCPPGSGSVNFNYKKQFSIVLMAVADASAKIIAFDLGAPGSQSDPGVFKDSLLSSLTHSEAIPKPRAVGQREPLPYFLIGDEAFALDTGMMKPYPHRTAMGDEKIFNYRLSRARRIVENAFGVMSARFRILLKTMELKPNNAIAVTRACITLHNFLIENSDKYCPAGFIDQEMEDGSVVPGLWRTEVRQACTLQPSRGVRSSTVDAREIRDILKDYFFREGEIDFQWRMTQ